MRVWIFFVSLPVTLWVNKRNLRVTYFSLTVLSPGKQIIRMLHAYMNYFIIAPPSGIVYRISTSFHRFRLVRVAAFVLFMIDGQVPYWDWPVTKWCKKIKLHAKHNRGFLVVSVNSVYSILLVRASRFDIRMGVEPMVCFVTRIEVDSQDRIGRMKLPRAYITLLNSIRRG